MPPAPNLRSELEVLLRRYGVPAVGLARTVGTRLESFGVIGERRHGSGIAVTENDLWHVGSCTKSMTATMMARLVEQGLLDWDAPIAPYVTQGGVHPAFAQISLRHVLSHYSGIPEEGSQAAYEACYLSNELPGQRAAFAQQTLADGPAYTPGTEFCYSNGGYVVAGAVAEAATGLSWEQLMQREFFAPLGITTGGFGAPGKGSGGLLSNLLGRADVTQPWGHMPGTTQGTFTDLRPDDEQSDNPAWNGPSGTVHLSLPDLARYVAYHASGGASVPGYLQPETVALLHTPQFGGQYAFGWSVSSAEETGIGRSAVWHEGTNQAWFCSLMFVPEDQRGLAGVCNGYQDSLREGEGGFGIQLLEIYNRWTGQSA